MAKKESTPIEQAFARVANTDDGKTVFRWLHDNSGYAQNIGTLDQYGEINTQSMIHDVARRGFYLELRKLLPFEARIAIENFEAPGLPEKTKDETTKEDDQLCHQKRTQTLEQERQEYKTQQDHQHPPKLDLLP